MWTSAFCKKSLGFVFSSVPPANSGLLVDILILGLLFRELCDVAIGDGNLNGMCEGRADGDNKRVLLMKSNQVSVGCGPNSLGANGKVAGEKFSLSFSGLENRREDVEDNMEDNAGSEMVLSGFVDTNLPFSSRSRSFFLFHCAVVAFVLVLTHASVVSLLVCVGYESRSRHQDGVAENANEASSSFCVALLSTLLPVST
ncbi:hypothetical protein VKT23_012449 [Stygiomarasmius scandens]|uniref:Transmembrane protein n=1 Tax=Marasmiellus scandens TaxID=2682957 RepID=A0ABR1JB26_9AGAR